MAGASDWDFFFDIPPDSKKYETSHNESSLIKFIFVMAFSPNLVDGTLIIILLILMLNLLVPV